MADIPAEYQAHRDALGKAITIWTKRNGWSQQTFHDWASAAGNEGPWNSQISAFQRGRHEGKGMFWVGLGRFNATIAAQDLSAVIPKNLEGKVKNPGHTARALRDRLKDSEPFLTADGRVATATDFFAMFIGEQPINACYLAPEPPAALSDDDAKGISEMCRDAFRRIAQDLMLNPKEAWETLKPHCTMLDATELARFREVLAGWSDWSGEEATALSANGELGRPAQALDRWAGGNTTINPKSLRRG